MVLTSTLSTSAAARAEAAIEPAASGELTGLILPQAKHLRRRPAAGCACGTGTGLR
ncbi:MAG: hypothetical protein NVSMB65_21700 [Chloroflexota bacterium]